MRPGIDGGYQGLNMLYRNNGPSAANPTSKEGTYSMLPKSMKAIHLTGHGGTDKLELRSAVPVPACGPHDVLVKVAAAGVNNTDINTRTGWYSKQEGKAGDASWSGTSIRFPLIQGIDVCGHIVAAGDRVPQQRLGERVLLEPCLREFDGKPLSSPWFLGSECNGGFAEYCVVPAQHAFAIESAWSSIELASFPCSYSTAENMLSRARVTQDDHVLVTGASGGVGSAAIQLARARGARVTAVTRSEKAESLLALGATRTVSREDNLRDALGENAVDVVIDLVAGPQWPQLIDVLKPFGRYATAGAIGGALAELDVRTLYLKDLTFYGCTVLDSGVFQALVRRIEGEEISPLVAAEFKLEDIVAAQDMFMSNAYTGKIVLQVTD